MQVKFILRQFAEQSLAMEKALESMRRIISEISDCGTLDNDMRDAFREMQNHNRDFTEMLQSAARRCESCSKNCGRHRLD